SNPQDHGNNGITSIDTFFIAIGAPQFQLRLRFFSRTCEIPTGFPAKSIRFSPAKRRSAAQARSTPVPGAGRTAADRCTFTQRSATPAGKCGARRPLPHRVNRPLPDTRRGGGRQRNALSKFSLHHQTSGGGPIVCRRRAPLAHSLQHSSGVLPEQGLARTCSTAMKSVLRTCLEDAFPICYGLDRRARRRVPPAFFAAAKDSMTDPAQLESETPLPGEAFLVIHRGPARRSVVPLYPGEIITIGRANANRIVIPDAKCSRHHCEIFFSECRWAVRDLDSRNGVLINGRQIEGEATLQPSDVLVIGTCEIDFTNHPPRGVQVPVTQT